MKNDINFVKRIIDKWDPVDLLACAPDDEYHWEIEEIEQLLILTDDPAELAAGIYKIFIDAFGNGIFTRSKLECMRIAKALLAQEEE